MHVLAILLQERKQWNAGWSFSSSVMHILLYGAEAVGIQFDVLCMRNENAHLLIGKFG